MSWFKVKKKTECYCVERDKWCAKECFVKCKERLPLAKLPSWGDETNPEELKDARDRLAIYKGKLYYIDNQGRWQEYNEVADVWVMRARPN